MRTTLLICVFLIGNSVFAQSEQVAKSYYDKGEFEKALIAYQRLYDQNRGNSQYFFKLVEIHQQLEQLDESERLLLEKTAQSQSPQYLVELGYNFQLKKDTINANENFRLAKLGIESRPVYAYNVARSFESHALIGHAAEVYERAMELRPESNYNMQLARIYGEMGDIEKMFSRYIDYIEFNNSFVNYAKRAFSEYISEKGEDENNKILRRVLLKKIQAKPNIIWNQLLSWLFVQQRDYPKAFAQEKAIHRRHQNLQGVSDLALITLEQDDVETANEILNYIVDNSYVLEEILEAHRNLLELRIKHGTKNELSQIDQDYKSLLMEFGITAQTLDLQLSYAQFMAFHLNDPVDASEFLKEALNLNLTNFQEARVKLKLGDILVFQEKYNEALIYYAQVQAGLKNSVFAQQARFRVARTSYYKGDFDWAETQLKVLKSSTSQLIANDALDLKLLISDNKYEDSTQTALKLYAKADLYAYQNKNDEAIVLLDQILNDHKTESIIDQALLKQAQLFVKNKEYDKAIINYNRIIEDFKDDILADDAYYELAELYVKILDQPEMAKPLYERIVFDHADSIYFVESRKKFRILRGDVIN